MDKRRNEIETAEKINSCKVIWCYCPVEHQIDQMADATTLKLLSQLMCKIPVVGDGEDGQSLI